MMRGFTLLELLVATAVFIGLVVILVSIAASLSSFWQLGIAHNERRSSALSAFSRMARDLRFASLPPDPSATNFQLVINPTKVGGSYLFPQAAFWQAPVASDRSRGNMALVGYFVQWVNETNGPVPKLCRLLIDSTNYQYQRPSDWISDTLIASKAPATKASDYDGQLAENVLGLWMQPLDQRKNPILNDAKNDAFPNGQFDSVRGYTVGLTNGSGTLVTKVFASALPASLEVALVAVDARTAKRLSGDEKPSARTADMWGDVNAFYNMLPPEIKQGARIYSTVIDLHSAPR
jgi:type II secretory pathway pseudopilin PulG